MKKMKIVLAALLMAGSTCIWAEEKDLNAMTDKQLSAHYQQKIDELNAEIKLVNTKLKADKDNTELHKRLIDCKAELATAKGNKKIVETSIKARTKADNAIAKADKMMEKAEKQKMQAQTLAKKAELAAREALKLRGGN